MEKKSRVGFAVLLSTMVIIGAIWFGNSQGSWVFGNTLAAEEVSSNSVGGDKSVISVSGTGEIKVEPDVAYLSLGVETEGRTANEAQQENAEVFAALEKSLLEDYKIDKKDIKTTSFRVNPKYNYQDNEEPKIVGYTASHIVQVTYRELDKIGVLLDSVSKAGANRIHNIQFSTEKTEQYKLEALEKAMGNAKIKADTIAGTLNRTIKGAVFVSENGTSGGVRPYYGVESEMLMAKNAADSSTSISSGEITITAEVNVQYEF